MNRDTAERVAEVAAILASQPSYTYEHGTLKPVPPHVAAREAIALANIAGRAHRFAERMCNEDIGETKIDRTQASLKAKANAIVNRFGLACAMQWDPRGWPIALLQNAEHAESWEYNGEPRELARVTPFAS